jgi:polyphosphate kinase
MWWQPTGGIDGLPVGGGASYAPHMAKPHDANGDGADQVPRKLYEQELRRLQGELVKVQEWVRAEGQRLVVIFEGRDAAGKGGAIKRVTEHLNPRFARIAALPAPTERERGQWYFQRYVDRLPTAGEIVLFDRSWYNRAGVENVMGYCSPEEYHRFLHQCPIFERLLVEDGLLLRKYWFSVSDAEQERRFHSRLDDPLRSWKLSPMDAESIIHWEDYSRAKDTMMVHTDIPESPWYVVESDDKRRARLNMIAHLLGTLDYREIKQPEIKLPERPGTRSSTCPTTRPASWSDRRRRSVTTVLRCGWAAGLWVHPAHVRHRSRHRLVPHRPVHRGVRRPRQRPLPRARAVRRPPRGERGRALVGDGAPAQTVTQPVPAPDS